MRKYMKGILLALLSTFTVSASAQTAVECPMHLSDIETADLLRARQLRKDIIASLKGSDVDEGQTIYIPMTAHIIRDNQGNQGLSEGDLYPLLCEINQFFSPVNMYLYLKGDVRYVNNQSLFWNYINSNDALFGMIRNHMDASYVDSTLNIYFTTINPNPNGATLLGVAPFPSMDIQFFNSRPAGVVMNKIASKPGNNTLAHELGHHFNLLHTFQGSNSISASFREHVTREAGIRNCESAGDGFCDTAADTLAYGCPYSGTARDLRGDAIVPDESLVMSYYNDNCTERFSPEQLAEMREVAFFNPQRNKYRFNGGVPDVTPVSVLDIALRAPANNASVPWNNIQLAWKPVPNANKYLVVINDASTGAMVAELASKDTSIVYSFPNTGAVGRRYNWSIKAYKEGNMCSNYVLFRSFNVTAATSIAQNFLDASTLEVFPNPVVGGAEVRLAFSAERTTEVTLMLTDMSGRMLQSQVLQLRQGANDFSLPLDRIANGMYMVSLQDGSGIISRKLLVQR